MKDCWGVWVDFAVESIAGIDWGGMRIDVVSDKELIELRRMGEEIHLPWMTW